MIVCYLCPATSQAIAPTLPVGEESPDSKEQCTGEEPGASINTERYVGVTESATENNCFSVDVAPGGNFRRLRLRVKVKT